MIIPLDKLFLLNDNKYIFTRAAMLTVEKIGNIQSYPEDDKSWKVVPNILNMILNGKVKYNYNKLED